MAHADHPRHGLGRAGEDVVARAYEQAGYSVVARNWRCREGELDLVVASGGTVVFCEVKTRTGRTFGEPFEAVGHVKQRRLRHLAARWLDEQPHGFAEVRFDVASVRWPKDGAGPEVEVIEGAF